MTSPDNNAPSKTSPHDDALSTTRPDDDAPAATRPDDIAQSGAGPDDDPRSAGGLTGDPAPTAGSNGPLPDLDPVIHAQARLRVVVALSQLPGGDRITFPRLQEILRMTAGNLSVHLRKLEEAGYVEVTKTHRGRTPATLVHLTQRGRFAFEEYVAALRTLIDPGEDPS
ncbi:winged helix-turn-helix domain-containing protein [Actinoplanes xinjiangensis]|uniref:winged helix-turn-helix domain-containing protein n=1 Tax=Actinoplanes xinjiangensis TaxID=512350 RepID=UPI0034375A24